MTSTPSTGTDAGTADMPADTAHPEQRLGGRYWRLFTATVVSNLGDGVGLVVYPWLASAITRNGLLIALIVVAQRLPWLVFTLPAGVITDRVDRRRLIVGMDTLRALITAGVGVAVLMQQDVLPGPDELDTVVGVNTGLYIVLIVATLLLGMAEVLRDNANQTILPSIVHDSQLERANGRVWSAEMVANTFVGPPLGGLLLGVAFALPIFVDAASFAAAAAIIATIAGTFRASPKPLIATTHEGRGGNGVGSAGAPRPSFRSELREGFGWLWAHTLLRPMAIILGLINLTGMVGGATLVLFAQEVLDINSRLFAILGFGAAIGGIIGGSVASALSKRYGPGTCLSITLGVGVVVPLIIGAVPLWPVVMVLWAIETMSGTLWNVITVSLRQSLIPDHLLGRVNSVYRFFAWGMMPIGAAIGGLVVVVVDSVASRDMALRCTWFAAAAISFGVFVFGRSKVTTERIEAARSATHQPVPSGG